MYEYEGDVLKIVDGDTLDVDVDLGMKVHIHERIRLKGIDTPEIFGVKKDSPEYEAGMEAKQLLMTHIPPGTRVKVRTFKDKTGKYGRYIADILFKDDEMKWINMADLLLEKELAKISEG